MRAALLFALAMLPAAAQAAEPAPAPVAVPAAPADPRAAEIEALRQRLLSAQQTIATLERQLSTTRDRAVLADQCRVKNGRLVFIARELIEAYEKRYHQVHNDPLQLGRRRFEFELQALSDAVYDNRAEVPVRVPADKPAGKTEPRADATVVPAPATTPSATPAPAKPSGQ